MTHEAENNTATLATVVLISGGMDSSVMLHHIVKNLGYTEIHALSFHYGQRHDRELKCARIQADAVGAHSHRVIDISFMGTMLASGSSLIQGGAAVPDLEEVAEEDLMQPSTYVPNRNMMLLSIAAAYAEAKGIQDICYGAQAQDEYGYWDCTRDFLDRINAVLQLNRKKPVRIHAPFVEKRKVDIVKLGVKLGVDFSQTWSCYRGEGEACGSCPTCVERLHAFDLAKVKDPLAYAEQG